MAEQRQSAMKQERAGSPRSGRSAAVHAGWRTRGYLPHYDEGETVQHIVFRVADALPPKVLKDLENAPREIRLDAAEEALDAGIGCQALADPRIANIVRIALLHFDAERYRLMAWCVMPTHVHLLAAQLPGRPLGTVVHGLKSFTANAANRVLGRTGAFWAPEYFDRMMRSLDQHERTITYIESNPVSARLCAKSESWPWSSATERVSSSRGAWASSPPPKP